MMYEAGMEATVAKDAKLLVGQGLGAGWESDAVGTKQQWEKGSQLQSPSGSRL